MPSVEDISHLQTQKKPKPKKPRLALIPALYKLTESKIIHLKTIAARGK